MTKKTNAKVAVAKAPANAEATKIATLKTRRVAKQNADTIIVAKGLATGNGTYVESAGGKNVIILPWQDKGVTRKLAVVGGSLAALNEHLATLTKPQAKLAHGVDSHNSPQSAKAVADQNKNAKKATKSAAPKAEKNKQPSRGAERTYTLGATKNTAKPDTWRHYMLTTIMGAKSTEAAKAAHAKSKKFSDNKLDFNWANAQGYIKFAK